LKFLVRVRGYNDWINRVMFDWIGGVYHGGVYGLRLSGTGYGYRGRQRRSLRLRDVAGRRRTLQN
jgi:hypothetical protein